MNNSNTNTVALNVPVDFTRIRQRTVRKFIQNNGLHKVSDFANLTHSCQHNPDLASFHRHVKTFSFRHPLEQVWSAYKTIGPVKTCSGSLLGFGLQYSRKSNRLTYHEDDHGNIEQGQIVFLNLRLLWSMVNLAVGHEITEVNEEGKYIQMCYLEGSASRGKQFIRLRESASKTTIVEHETFYKSDSNFRDKRLYPFLHGLVISEFHRNVESRIRHEARA